MRYLGMRDVVGPMIDAGAGSIVNVSSGQGLAGAPDDHAQATSKSGLRGLTKSAPVELAGNGIRPLAHEVSIFALLLASDESSDATVVDARLTGYVPVQLMRRHPPGCCTVL